MRMKRQRGRIDPEIEPDGAADHHDQDEGLGGERLEADPTWAPTNSPLAAPAIASPMRSRTWANFLTRDLMA